MPGSSMLNTPVTTWRDSVTSEVRLHLVHKFLQAIVPGVQKTAINDPRFRSIVVYARHTENFCYENATSRSEYYHLLAQKIYKVTAEIQRRKEDRRTFEDMLDITDKLKNL